MVTSFTYDATTGDLLSTTDPLGGETTYTYDDLGRATALVPPNGNLSAANPAEWETTSTFDPDGRPLTTTAHTGPSTTAVTTRTYDADGNLATLTDPNGNITSYTYDAADQLIQVARPDSSVTTNDYWPDGQLKAQWDASTTRTALYDHDALGRLTSVTNALNQVTGFGYDNAGNLAWKAYPGGSCPTTGTSTNCVRYAYDAAHQLTNITYSDGTTPNVAHTYRADGQRATMVDGTGTTTYTYDSLGRLKSTATGSSTVTYGYNLRDLVTSIAYPGLGTLARSWDDAGRIDTITDWASRAFTYTHDANGNVTDITYPSASSNVDTFGYDNADRMTASEYFQGSTSLADISYAPDAGGRLTARTETGLPGSATFGYTELDQLCFQAPSGTGTCSSPPMGATAYAYDPADNLTTGPIAATQQFNAANQLCWTSPTPSTNGCSTAPSGATTFTYDTRGNRTATTPPSAPSTTYTYDLANRLTGSTTNSTTTTNTYNGDGLRASTTTGSTTKSFTWSHAEGLPMLLSDSTYAYLYGPDGKPLAQIALSGGAITYLHHDQLGSTRLLTDSTGNAVGTATYDAYGTPATTGTTSALGYTGQYTDPSGLQYLRARYYDPATAQFLNRDPLEAQTHEAYGYAGGNPLNNVDPTGLNWLSDRASDLGNGIMHVGGAAVNAVQDHAGEIVGGAAIVGAGACIVLTEGACAVAVGQGLWFTAGAVTTASVVGVAVYDAHEVGELVRNGDTRKQRSKPSACGPVYRGSPPSDAWDRFGRTMLDASGYDGASLPDPPPGSGQYQPILRPVPFR